jgi:hypothetical protein
VGNQVAGALPSLILMRKVAHLRRDRREARYLVLEQPDDLAMVRMIRPQPCEQVQGDLDTGQRIVDLVDNNGRHLADHRQPRGVVHRRFRRTQPFDQGALCPILRAVGAARRRPGTLRHWCNGCRNRCYRLALTHKHSFVVCVAEWARG